MSTYFAPTVAVNPEINRDVDEIIARSQAAAAEMETAYADLATKLQILIDRMHSAMNEIAEAAGAWHCDYCGEWTTETIDVANYSDELGYEMQSHCRRCVPSGVRLD